MKAFTPNPLTLNNDQAPPGGAWSKNYNKTAKSWSFELHNMNSFYFTLQLFTDGVVAFTYDNITIPPFNVCQNFTAQLTNAPKQTAYFKLLATNLTSVDSYGALYFR